MSPSPFRSSSLRHSRAAACASRASGHYRIRSVGVGAFGFVLEHPPGFRVDTDLLRDAALLDVERVAQPASATLLFELFVGNLAGCAFSAIARACSMVILALPASFCPV